MKVNKFFGKRSIIFSFLISYLCIFIVPILSNIFIYKKSLKVVEQEINQANTDMLHQVQQTLDSRLVDVNNLLLLISLDNRILSLMYAKDQLNAVNKYILPQMIDDLHSYTVTNSFIKNLYVFFKNTDLIITPNVSFDTQYAYKHFNYSSISYQEWYDIMTEKSHSDAIVFSKDHNNQLNKSIAFVQSIPMQYKKDPLASVVIELDTAVFDNIMKNIDWVSRRVIAIIDQDNQILYSTEKIELPSFIEYDKLVNKEGTILGKIKDQDVVVSYIESEICNWKYVSIVSNNIYMQNIHMIKQLGILCLVFCFILGIILMIFFSKKNYDPIHGLVKVLRKETSSHSYMHMNEVKFIQEFIDKTLEEKKKLQDDRIEYQRKLLKENFLKRLIKGQISIDIPILDACESYNIYFYSNDFVVMVLNIENINEDFFSEDIESYSDSLEIIYFIIKNVIEELIGQKNMAYTVETDEFLICLINLKEFTSQDETKKQLLNLASYAVRFIQEKFGITFFIAISNTYKDFTGIPKAYQQAIEVIEYKNLMGGEEVIHYDDIQDVEEYSVEKDSFYNRQQQFSNCIKVGDYKAAQIILNDMIESEFIQSSIPTYLVKWRISTFKNTFMHVIGEVNIYEESLLKKFNIVEQLANCYNIKELQSVTNHILENIYQYALEKQKYLYNNQIEEIKKFIENKYFNPNLSVSLLADQFEMKTSYLSKVFRESTGVGLLDYIHKERINKSKELLKDEKLTIKAIAKKTGYINSDTFIRVFKKQEGITPGKYREIIKYIENIDKEKNIDT